MEATQDVHELFRSVLEARAQLQPNEVALEEEVAWDLELFQDLTVEDEDRLPTWIGRAFSL